MLRRCKAVGALRAWNCQIDAHTFKQTTPAKKAVKNTWKQLFKRIKKYVFFLSFVVYLCDQLSDFKLLPIKLSWHIEHACLPVGKGGRMKSLRTFDGECRCWAWTFMRFHSLSFALFYKVLRCSVAGGRSQLLGECLIASWERLLVGEPTYLTDEFLYKFVESLCTHLRYKHLLSTTVLINKPAYECSALSFSLRHISAVSS